MIIILGKPILIPGTADQMGGNKLSTKESIIAREDKTLKKVNFLFKFFISVRAWNLS